MLKIYYQLTKPGIIYGNLITAMAGFFLASKSTVNWGLFVVMIFGLSLVIASACVFNNILDADIDAKMSRTKDRAIPSGQIGKNPATIFALVLFICGLAILYYFCNLYAFFAALLGFVVYGMCYTPLKRVSVYATLVGAVSGAAPIVVGYTAASGAFDMGAGILFFILFFWQMVHFYGIGIYRLIDYSNAGLPILPVKKSVQEVKIHIVAYTLVCSLLFPLLTHFNYTGNIYLAAIVLVCIYWLWQVLSGFAKGIDETKWGRQIFLSSLIVLTLFSLLISIDSFIH